MSDQPRTFIRCAALTLARLRGWLLQRRASPCLARSVGEQAVAAERIRIAQELHDEIGALLTAARLELACLQRAAAGLDVGLQQRIICLNQLLNRCQKAKQQIVHGLWASANLSRNLRDSLLKLQADFQQHLEIELDMHDVPQALDQALVHAVYRVAQEALTNAVKHGNATKVALRTLCSDTQFTIEVRDNGCGMAQPALRGKGKGLAGMHARVQQLQGQLHVESAPGGGACVVAQLPLHDTAQRVLRNPDVCA